MTCSLLKLPELDSAVPLIELRFCITSHPESMERDAKNQI